MKILIAPDKFKGSLTAVEVCDIVRSVLLENNSKHQVTSVPLADGGEGTCQLLTHFSNGKFISTQVLDPLMREINSVFGVSADGKIAFIEMALASGLQLLKPQERDCLLTSTFGTGQLIGHALDQGAREIVIGIGGSATNDAGTGMAQALGYQFLSASGRILNGIGKNLIDIQKIDSANAHHKIKDTKFTILSDVDSPLYGKSGSAFVFAKQKGASQNDILLLDRGLRNFASVSNQMNFNLDFPGAGAAGGLGAGAKLFLNANIKHGIDFIIDFTRLEEKIEQTDVVITGEGKIDEQTLSGKVIKGVAHLARKYNKKVIVVTGICELNEAQILELGLAQVITLVNSDTSIAEAMQNAKHCLYKRLRKIEF